MTTHQRFWEKVTEGPNGCWDWTDALDRGGYGRFKVRGKNIMAHRYAYQEIIGELPAFVHGGYELDHVGCDRRCCVNPQHLKLVLHKENVLRGRGIAAEFAKRSTCARGHLLPSNEDRRCKKCSALSDAKRHKTEHSKQVKTTYKKLYVLRPGVREKMREHWRKYAAKRRARIKAESHKT